MKGRGCQRGLSGVDSEKGSRRGSGIAGTGPAPRKTAVERQREVCRRVRGPAATTLWVRDRGSANFHGTEGVTHHEEERAAHVQPVVYSRSSCWPRSPGVCSSSRMTSRVGADLYSRKGSDERREERAHAGSRGPCTP